MKLAIGIAAIAIAGLDVVVGEWTAVRGGAAGRQLAGAGPASDSYAFLVSSISDTDDWCITATEGSGKSKGIGFRPCDYAGAPSNQLWRIDDEGKVHTKLNPNRCMIVDFGKHLEDARRVRLADCNESTDLNKFVHNGSTDTLRVANDEDLCVTNQGVSPHKSDKMHVKPCTDKGQFIFTYSPAELTFFYSKDAKGCLGVEDGKAREGQNVVLSDEATDPRRCQWKQDDGLFRSALNPNLCMQAGHPEATAKIGKKLRLYKCDKDNSQQKFEYDGDVIKHVGTNLCAAFQGENGQVGDNIILKDCNDSEGQNGWSVSQEEEPSTSNVCFMLYQMADNNLEGVLRDDLLELINSEAIHKPELTTWVYFDALNEDWYGTDPLPGVWEKDGSELLSEKWKGSRYLTFSHSLGKMIAETTLQGEQDSDNPETLSKFVEHALCDCVARGTTEYIIALSDHGGGYSGFGGDYNVRRLVAQNNELVSALKEALDSVPGAPALFDVIGFDACLMMAFGALDEFGSDITKYFLASQMNEPGHGWAYQQLSKVESALDLAKDIHENFLSVPQYGYQATPKTMAIVDTVKFESFRNALEELSAELKSLLDAGDDPGISTAVNRAQAQAFSDWMRVDMGRFFTNLWELCGPVPGTALNTLLPETLSAYQDMFVIQGVGVGTASVTGMHVFFPSREDYEWYWELEDELFNDPDLATLEAPNWLAFMRSFYAADNPIYGPSDVCLNIQGLPLPGPPTPGPMPGPTPSFPLPPVPTGPPTEGDDDDDDGDDLILDANLVRTTDGVVLEATISPAAYEVIVQYGIEVAGTFYGGGTMMPNYDGLTFSALWTEVLYAIGDDPESLLYVQDLGNGAKSSPVMYFPPGTISENASLVGITVEEAEELGGMLGSLSFFASGEEEDGIDFTLFASLNDGTTSGIPPSNGGSFVPIIVEGAFADKQVLGGHDNAILQWMEGHAIKIFVVDAEEFIGQLDTEANAAISLAAISSSDREDTTLATSEAMPAP